MRYPLFPTALRGWVAARPLPRQGPSRATMCNLSVSLGQCNLPARMPGQFSRKSERRRLPRSKQLLKFVPVLQQFIVLFVWSDADDSLKRCCHGFFTLCKILGMLRRVPGPAWQVALGLRARAKTQDAQNISKLKTICEQHGRHVQTVRSHCAQWGLGRTVSCHAGNSLVVVFPLFAKTTQPV